MDSCQSPFNIMRDLDSKMVKFFHSVLEYEIKRKTKTYADNVEEVARAYCKETMRSGESDICFNSHGTRCAYVYRYCATTATATAYHFMQLLKYNTALYQKITFSDCFHVCCLGGGPGTEIAAISKILDGLMNSYSPTRRKPLLIKATIIDKDSGWSVTAGNLIRSLSQLVDKSLVRCELNFIECNLTDTFTREVTEALRNADFVTMVRFLSAVNGSKFKDRTDQMLQEVISCLKEDCTLFYLDVAYDELFHVFRKAVKSLSGLSETYGPVEGDLYKMSVFAVADSMKLNSRYFGNWLPPFLIVNHISAWSRVVPNPRGKNPTAVVQDVDSRQREIEKHKLKCIKFCFPRQKDMIDFAVERTFGGKGVFSTKSKNKRI